MTNIIPIVKINILWYDYVNTYVTTKYAHDHIPSNNWYVDVFEQLSVNHS